MNEPKARNRKRWTAAWAAALFLSLLAAPFASAQEAGSDEEIMNLAAGLVELRDKVESLSTELELKKAEMRDLLQSAAVQKAELETQLKKEELRLRQIEQNIAKEKEEVSSDRDSRESLKPTVLAQVAAIRDYVDVSLPFKRSERVSELNKIEGMLQRDELKPETALAQLWALLEDEFRLTRENGLYRQPILVEGEEMLADVARIGMVLMYFKTNDDEVGKVVRAGDGWVYDIVENSDDRDRILHLFDSLKKRIRVGYFELPNAL